MTWLLPTGKFGGWSEIDRLGQYEFADIVPGDVTVYVEAQKGERLQEMLLHLERGQLLEHDFHVQR